MSQHRKAKPDESPVAGTSPAPATLVPEDQSNFPHGVVLVLLVTGIVIAFGLWWFKLRPAETKGATAPAATTQAVNPPAAAVTPQPDFQKLKGCWQRPDGGYVLDIKSIGADGQMDMTYLNPKSIHVAKAQATQDGPATKVFIELQDVNYPGCTYNLEYVPERDMLHGIYYQALLQQQYEVVFVHLK